MDTFDIFSQVTEELGDFFRTRIRIASAVVEGQTTGGFRYNQYQTIQNIEFVDNSQFINGAKDREGNTKFYLNTASFRKEVASKNIDLDVKNFLFVPEEGQSEYGAIIARKKFKKWAKEHGLSDLLNDSVDRFPKYGTIVAKRIGKTIEITPLGKLRNQQDAKSLATATYVIEEHTDMTRQDFEAYPDWDLSELELKDFDSTATAYERYGYVPVKWFKSKGGLTSKGDDESVYCMVVLTLDKAKKGAKAQGAVLFVEECECPYIERHYARQDGRWLGIGEIEKQIDNQAARNMIFNLRKKSLGWASKNVYGTSDDMEVNNLSRQVKDGDVLKMSNKDSLWRIDTVTRATNDYQTMTTEVENNANQRSFTFEVATGEALPSGTPFRLGAMLSNSVNTYYDKKREVLGLFWKDIVFELMIPNWIKDTEEEWIEGVFDTEEGFDELRAAKEECLVTEAIVNAVIQGKPVDIPAIRTMVKAGLGRVRRDYYKMTKKELKNLKYRVDLDITGESIDIPKKIETLTTLYQAQIQVGDTEGAKITMNKILPLTGERSITTVSTPAPTISIPNKGAAVKSPMQMMSEKTTEEITA